MTHKRRILLITSELFPEFGYPTAGGGVRAAQLYHCLSRAGHQVALALSKATVEGRDLPTWSTQYLYDSQNLDVIIEKTGPDIVLSEGWEPLSHRKFADTRLYIADIPGPLVLEKCLGEASRDRQVIQYKVRTLQQVDAVICPSERVRHYLSAYLILAGWSPTDTDRILHIPIGLPDELPERPSSPSPPWRRGQGLVVFVGGISWAWHQSSSWILRLADEFQKRNLGMIRLRMGRHPIHLHEERIFESIDNRLLDHPNVSLGNLTHWNELVTELCGIPLAIEWSPKHLEREIASTLRLVTCLWCGIPLIVRPHLEIAREIEEYQAGWVVDSWDDLITLVESVRHNPSELKIRSNNAHKLVRDRHTWSMAGVNGLDAFGRLTQRTKAPHEYDRWFQMVQAMELDLHSRQETIFHLKHVIGQRDEVIRTRDHSIADLHQHLANRMDDIGAREREIQARDREIQVREREVNRLWGEVSHLSAISNELSVKVKANDQDAESYRALRQKLLYRLWKRVIG